MAVVQTVPTRRQSALHSALPVGTVTMYSRLVKLMFVSGDANFVVECHGAAVKDGDFCCSINGSNTCCNTASNGLGLVPAVSSAQAVSATSILANAVPTSTDKGATCSSSGTTESKDLLHFVPCMLISGSYIPALHLAPPPQRNRRIAQAVQARSRNHYPGMHPHDHTLLLP